MNKIVKSAFILAFTSVIASCSSSPTVNPELSVTEWPTDQLVSKGQSEFERGNYTDSSPYLREAAKRDDQSALYALGYMYYYGLGVNKDVNMSRDLIRRSAAFGYRPAVKALRLFVATKSIFNVNTSNVDYIATNSTPQPQTTPDTKLADIHAPAVKFAEAEPAPQPKAQPKLAQNLIEQQPFTTFYNESELALNNSADEAVVAPKQKQTKPDITSSKVEKLVTIDQTPENLGSELKKSSDTSNLIARDTTEIKPEAEAVQNSHEVALKPTKEINKATIKTPANAGETKLASSEVISPIATQSIVATDTADQESLNNPEFGFFKTAVTSKPNNWLKKQNPNDYTIQITAKKSLPELKDFLSKNNLSKKVEIFSYVHKNQTWYGAGYGTYKKPSQAYQTMLNDMPSDINSKPWVRQFKNIQLADNR